MSEALLSLTPLILLSLQSVSGLNSITYSSTHALKKVKTFQVWFLNPNEDDLKIEDDLKNEDNLKN